MNKPLSRKFLLNRGYCCHHNCTNCPYMKYNLFLDDVRFPHQIDWVKIPTVDWIIVRNYDQFVKTITDKGLPQRVSFDHDLDFDHYMHDWKTEDPGSDAKTGMDCVKWLVEYCDKHNKSFPTHYMHSMNPVGCKNMESYIKSYNKSKTL